MRRDYRTNVNLLIRLVNTWMSKDTALDLAQNRHYFHLDFHVYLITV